jgi:putative endonuclease
MVAAKDEVGRFGEDVAERYAREQGWEILARNWRCAHGELDLVAVDGDELAVVEVKTRRSQAFGAPEEAVTADKLARLRRLTGAWLESQSRSFAGLRIDVIAVSIPVGGAAKVEHLRGVG